MLYGGGGTHEESFEILDRVFDLGCRFWDTAEVSHSITKRLYHKQDRLAHKAVFEGLW